MTPRFALESTANANGMWRDLWNRSYSFESGRAAYVFCGDLSEGAPLARQVEVIPRLPFSMLIDIAQKALRRRSSKRHGHSSGTPSLPSKPADGSAKGRVRPKHGLADAEGKR